MLSTKSLVQRLWNKKKNYVRTYSDVNDGAQVCKIFNGKRSSSYYAYVWMTHINNRTQVVLLFADYLLNAFSRHRTVGAMAIIGTSVIRTKCTVLWCEASNKNIRVKNTLWSREFVFSFSMNYKKKLFVRLWLLRRKNIILKQAPATVITITYSISMVTKLHRYLVVLFYYLHAHTRW